MNCPSCERNLASTLSVCPSCGTMMNDSIREELAVKITPLPKNPDTLPRKFIEKPSTPISQRLKELRMPQTNEIMTKTTSPTLIDFQHKNASVPEWRLQVQNAVRMRTGRSESVPGISLGSAELHEHPTNGATALKPDIKPETSEGNIKNQAVINALKRIESSRQKYLAVETLSKAHASQFARPNPPAAPYTVARKNNSYANPADATTTASYADEAVTPRVRQFDTNKLPPLPLPAKISSSFDRKIEIKIEADHETDELTEMPMVTETKAPLVIQETKRPEVAAFEETEVTEGAPEIQEYEEFDDCAPFSLRVNSAIFDLLICSFASFVMLSPFMLISGRLFSVEGLFAFIAVLAIVTFIYMTTTIGLLGRTYGMKLFSLEIIDAEENDYPTLHQAAVSSSLYIVSLAMMGLGFVPAFFTREKRAFHDLISGTVIIREYD